MVQWGEFRILLDVFIYFFGIFMLFFIIKFVFFLHFVSFFDDVSDFYHIILINQKKELVRRNCQQK